MKTLPRLSSMQIGSLGLLLYVVLILFLIVSFFSGTAHAQIQGQTPPQYQGVIGVCHYADGELLGCERLFTVATYDDPDECYAETDLEVQAIGQRFMEQFPEDMLMAEFGCFEVPTLEKQVEASSGPPTA